MDEAQYTKTAVHTHLFNSPLLVIPGLYALWRGRSLPTNEGNAMTTDAC